MDTKIKKNATILLIFSLLSKGMAFFREILLAYFFGIALLLDAYNAGISFSNTLLFLFSGGAFIPLLISFYTDTEKKDEGKLNAFILILMIMSVLISVVTVYAAPFIISDVSEAIRSDVITVVRITAFSTLFYALSSVIRAKLNHLGEYGYSGAQDFAMMCILIIGIYLSSKGNSLFMLSLSYLLASVFRVIVQLPALWKYKGEINMRVEWVWQSVLTYSVRFFPMIIATLIPQVMIIITRVLSSHLDSGTISGLSYADRTSDLIKSVVAYSLGAVIVAPLAKHIKENDVKKYIDLLNKSLLYAFYISIPLFLLFLIWGREIIAVMYQRGSFSGEATRITGVALSYYSVATLFSSPIFIVMSAIYSINHWRAVLVSSLISVTVGTVFMFLTYKSLGVIGIALGVGVYSVLIFILLYALLLGKFNHKLEQGFLTYLLKLLLINSLVFALVWMLYRFNSLSILILPPLLLAVLVLARDRITIDLLNTMKRIISKRF